ncbi:MAG: TraC family protein [Patescibacteria group bacterium]
MESLQSKKVQEKQIAATQKFLRIKGIRDGIVILESGAMRSAVLVSSINFALLSPDEQNAKLFGFQDFLNSLEFPVEIIVQTRALNISQYLEKIKEAERMQENELLRRQISTYGEYISSLVEEANITTKHFYVAVPYMPPTSGGGPSGPFGKLKSLFSPAAQVEKELETFEKSKEELFSRVSIVIAGLRGMGLRAAPLDTQEIVELLYSWYNPEVSQTEVLADLDALKLEKY